MLKQDMHVYRMVAIWPYIKDPRLSARHGIDDDIPGFPEPSPEPVPDAVHGVISCLLWRCATASAIHNKPCRIVLRHTMDAFAAGRVMRDWPRLIFLVRLIFN